MRNNLKFSTDNLAEAIQDLGNRKAIEAVIKVNVKENHDLVKSLLKAYCRFKEKGGDDGKVVNVMKIA